MPSNPGLTTTSRSGATTAPWSALDATGNDVPNDGNTFVELDNRSATTPLGVTIDAQGLCDQGVDHNVAFTIPVGESRILGPYPVVAFGGTLNLRYTGTHATFNFIRAYRPVS